MDKEELLFEAFRKAIDLASRNTTPIGFMAKLRDAGFTKLELMIVDSAVKAMPLRELWKTLILSRYDYLQLIETSTVKLLNITEDDHQ